MRKKGLHDDDIPSFPHDLTNPPHSRTMMLPLLLAASLITTNEVPGMATVHIPMPAMITPNE